MKLSRIAVTVLISVGATAALAGEVACNATVPAEILMQKWPDGQLVQSWKMTPNSPWVIKETGDKATRAIFNCSNTPAGSVQFVQATVYTEGFYAYSGDTHLAILAKTKFVMNDQGNPTAYLGRGMVVDKKMGFRGERFGVGLGHNNLNQCAVFPPKSLTSTCVKDSDYEFDPVYKPYQLDAKNLGNYNISLHSGPDNINFLAVDTSTNQSAGGPWAESTDHVTLNTAEHSHIAFAWLFRTADVGQFGYHIKNIRIGYLN